MSERDKIIKDITILASEIESIGKARKQDVFHQMATDELKGYRDTLYNALKELTDHEYVEETLNTQE